MLSGQQQVTRPDFYDQRLCAFFFTFSTRHVRNVSFSKRMKKKIMIGSKKKQPKAISRKHKKTEKENLHYVNIIIKKKNTSRASEKKNFTREKEVEL